MRRALCIILTFLLVTACSRSSMELSYVRLERKDGNVVVNADITGDADDVSFLLVSPDGDLEWEGRLEKKGGRYVSDTLLITPGALFPEGKYHIYIYTADGDGERDVYL